MNKTNDEEPLKGQTPEVPGTAGKAVAGKKTLVPDTDTAPDELIGRDADTDQPVGRQILNDGVLRGEKPYDAEEDVNTDKEEGPKKMDAGKQ